MTNLSHLSLPQKLDLLKQARHAIGQGQEDSPAVWARQYAGRASEFIGEIMGPLWYGTDWLAWRAFVKTLFGESLTHDELALFRQCTELDVPPGRRLSEAWLPVGRRGGKSRILALIAVHLACCYDWTPYLVPGESGVISVLAALRPQARAIMGYVKAALKHPKLERLVAGKMLAESVELKGQVTIEVVTASITAVRSRTMIAALCDEIAFWRSDEDSANPDEEILNALRPAMATIPGRMLLGASSRYARRGVLWEAYRNYYGKVEGPLVWSADTQTMHPSIDQDFLREEYEKDPVAAAAEYGLEFRSDIAAFVLREAVEALIDTGVYERPPISGIAYRAFVDPSGGSSDSMTLAIAHAERGTAYLDLLREVRPPFSPESVVREFTDTLRQYRVDVVRGDHYGGLWPRERFAVNGITYEVSEATKSDIYQAWLPLINASRMRLLDNTRLLNQTCSLERKVSRAGKDSIDHPPGGHDDVVNVAAGALVIAIDPAAVAMDSLWSAHDLAA